MPVINWLQLGHVSGMPGWARRETRAFLRGAWWQWGAGSERVSRTGAGCGLARAAAWSLSLVPLLLLALVVLFRWFDPPQEQPA